jgi:hypothetical protein
MNEEARARTEDLLYVLNAPAHLRKRLICTKELAGTFAEVILNILYGEIRLSEENKKTFTKSKRACEKIATEKKGVDQKISVIRQLDDEVLDAVVDVLEEHV